MEQIENNKKINIKIEKLSYLQCAEYIKNFLDDESNWSELIKQQLPKVNKNNSTEEISKLLEEKFKSKEKKYNSNIKQFLKWWDRDGIFDYNELLKIVETNSPEEIHEITWQVGNTFICPRDIEHWSFVMSAELWKWSAINVALHEITHFIWFTKIKQIENIKHFSQNNDDENYQPFWLLSEIVIDPILNSTTFAKKYDMTWKSYPEFYNIKIKNKNLMEYIKTLWNTRTNFMDFYTKSSKFVYNNWKEINEKYLFLNKKD